MIIRIALINCIVLQRIAVKAKWTPPECVQSPMAPCKAAIRAPIKWARQKSRQRCFRCSDCYGLWNHGNCVADEFAGDCVHPFVWPERGQVEKVPGIPMVFLRRNRSFVVVRFGIYNAKNPPQHKEYGNSSRTRTVKGTNRMLNC